MRRPLFILAISACFTALQISAAVVLAPSGDEPLSKYQQVSPPEGWQDSVAEYPDLLKKYLRLNNWDSLRYFEIARNGYHSPAPELLSREDLEKFRANVVFFPGYPILARILSQVTGAAIQIALLLVAHLSTFAFWIFFFGFLQVLKLDRVSSSLLGLWVLAFPTAFYMTMGYSESLFLACMMGYIYGTETAVTASSRTRGFRIVAWSLTGLLGFGMCSTRLMGLPILLYPVLRQWAQNRYSGERPPSSMRKDLSWAVAATGIAFLGTAGFFLFCQLEFGRWDFYMISSRVGWGVYQDPWAVFRPLNYLPRFFFETTELSLDRSIAPMTMIGLLLAMRSDPAWKVRAGFYFSVICMHYLLVSSKAHADFISVARHGHTLFILLALAFAHQPGFSLRWNPRSRRFWGYAFLLLLLLAIQIYMTIRFTRGRWVE
ncbi:MAG: hypothetical protein A2X94_05040 [Bdellovibrionales bacterium GWB1_55_8]|nr:MAG: hypothetical protein A2X94_05040 [Bdellovibrionales bacterium GWB1_55_8]